MKKCPMCGAIQNDSRNVCIDCSARLGKSMSKEDEAAIDEAVDGKLDESGAKTDFFYTPIVLRIIGIISVIAIIALAVLTAVTFAEKGALKSEMEEKAEELGIFMSDAGNFVFSGDGTDVEALEAYKNNIDAHIDALEDRAAIMLISIVPLAASAVTLLFPSAVWTLETWTWRRMYSVAMEPTFMWLTVARVFGCVCFALGAAGLICAITLIV